MRRFAYFVSAHGFGHAARATAVIAALRRRLPGSRFTVFTTVPSWFLADALEEPPEVRPVAPDIGLVQKDALVEDLDATVERLAATIPFRAAELDALAAELAGLAPDLVLCDVAPIGLAAARRAGIASLLVENFTWDFIYRGYGGEKPELLPLADALAEVFAGADHHVQAEPFCVAVPGSRRVGPVARAPRHGRAATREALGIPADERAVLVTMGGVSWDYGRLAADLAAGDPWIVVPGGAERPRRDGRVIRLPHRSGFHHPDLVTAVDAVVGKLGYSTLAEVAAAGVPMAWVDRPRFPESARLAAWVREHLPHRPLLATDLEDGTWLAAVRELVHAPRRPVAADGAAAIAEIVAEIVG